MPGNDVLTSIRILGLLVALLNLSGAGPVDNNLHQATELGDPMRIDQLAGLGASLDRADSLGHTPLTIAIRNRDIMTVGMLLKLGANPNLLDSQNKCLVRIAQSLGETDIVQLLRRYGASCRTSRSDASTTD
jgi:ankyrin repeat protein